VAGAYSGRIRPAIAWDSGGVRMTFGRKPASIRPEAAQHSSEARHLNFESDMGSLVRSGNNRLGGLWSRRMSTLGVFFGDYDENGDYIRIDHGNAAAVRAQADEWLQERGFDPTTG